MEKKFTAKVLVRRAFDFSNVEVELTSNQELTLDEVNDLRQQAAKLVDEGIRELKKVITIEKERDSLLDKINKLESAISQFPQFNSGENFGLIDTSKLSAEEKTTLLAYGNLRNELEATQPYNYSDKTENLLDD